MRAHSFATGALTLLFVLLVGCGDSAGERTRALGSDTQEIGPAEVERFANIDLPSGLSDFEAEQDIGGMDESVSARFSIPRDGLDSMRSILTEPLEEGFPAVSEDAIPEWDFGDSSRFLGASDLVEGVGRAVLVDLDVPGRLIVYVTASTI